MLEGSRRFSLLVIEDGLLDLYVRRARAIQCAVQSKHMTPWRMRWMFALRWKSSGLDRDGDGCKRWELKR
jgi:hypothetical protein